ncbi:hypothetical protein [Endozoicomonas sp.]|uniref:hypothetical protein n=1 Tax=Endozoicomonas sp. TaxID=1892382 RepID=UPI00288454ED|nr:hypothetical protein [Endozoicomonas sp.]
MISAGRIGINYRLMDQILKYPGKVVFQGRRCNSLKSDSFSNHGKKMLANAKNEGVGFTYYLNNYKSIQAITVKQRSIKEIPNRNSMLLKFKQFMGVGDIDEDLKKYDVITIYVQKSGLIVSLMQYDNKMFSFHSLVIRHGSTPEAVERLRQAKNSSEMNSFLETSYKNHSLVKLPMYGNSDSIVDNDREHIPGLHKTENPLSLHFHIKADRSEVNSLVKKIIQDNEPRHHHHCQQFKYSKDFFLPSPLIKGFIFSDGSYSQNEVSTNLNISKAPPVADLIKISDDFYDAKADSDL